MAPRVRNLTDRVTSALGDTPAVLLIGPRQAGKTTLAEAISRQRGGRFVSLDSAAPLAAASADPEGFVLGLGDFSVVDEVQRVPALLRALKLAIDRERHPGRFLLTGSANVLTLPRVSESLAGRLEVASLWTFSQGELAGVREEFVDAAFGTGEPPDLTGRGRSDLVRRALAGGFPEVLERSAPERREAWFSSYLTTLVQRDARDLSNVENPAALLRLLGLLGARNAALLNLADLSRTLALPHTTLGRYLALLEALLLVVRVPAWSAARGGRYLKAPRLFFADTGLAAHLAGLGPERLEADPQAAGPLLENLVALELLRQLGWSRTRATLFHLRTHAGSEVDLVLERADGKLVGIEVKAGQAGGSDFRGLEALARVARGRFHRGLVLCGGGPTTRFGERMWAAPIDAVWTWAAQPNDTAPRHD